jgi:hypothetical protein
MERHGRSEGIVRRVNLVRVGLDELVRRFDAAGGVVWRFERNGQHDYYYRSVYPILRHPFHMSELWDSSSSGPEPALVTNAEEELGGIAIPKFERRRFHTWLKRQAIEQPQPTLRGLWNWLAFCGLSTDSPHQVLQGPVHQWMRVVEFHGPGDEKGVAFDYQVVRNDERYVAHILRALAL